MMLRRILFQPGQLSIFNKRWNSTYQSYKPIRDFSRLKVQVVPTDPIYNIYCNIRVKPVNKEGRPPFYGHHENANTINTCFRKDDLNYKNQLELDLFILCLDSKAIECFQLKINSSAKESQFKLEVGTTEVNVETTIDEESDVKFREKGELCSREEEFISIRKNAVFDKMHSEFGLSDVKDVPTIAVIGSGGGMRAVVGMCGAMTALQNEGILDYTMYTAGLSGSAWYLMTLYADNEKFDATLAHRSIRKRLVSFRLRDILKLRHDIFKRDAGFLPTYRLQGWREFFSLTRRFGDTIGNLLLQEKSDNKWSEQTTKLEDGNVPLPLIAALHVRGDKTITAYNEWIELSPYEVFIPKYGAAIDMKDFGDEFYGGFVIENCGEKPISFLQGMCGSGYAIIRNLRPTEIRRLMFWSAFKLWIRSWFTMFDRKFIWKVPNYLRGLSTVPVNKFDKGQRMDSVDVEKRDMMLVDAGIAFNSPYPTVFRPSRKVDVILSFDFSDRGEDTRWPFRELENASQWARERNIPFPHIDPLLKEIREKCADSGDYEEVYIFPGDDSPTIVHFVMINKSFRNAETFSNSDFKILPTYATLKLRYTNVDFDKLSRLTMHNVQNNKDKILESIRAEIKKKT